MSKMDGLRAMREARYAENAARAKTPAPIAKQPVAKSAAAKKPRATPDRAETPAVETADAGLCGHRAISGRTCTREKGHAAKSHRYA
jgi:hypothetical protein